MLMCWVTWDKPFLAEREHITRDPQPRAVPEVSWPPVCHWSLIHYSSPLNLNDRFLSSSFVPSALAPGLSCAVCWPLLLPRGPKHSSALSVPPGLSSSLSPGKSCLAKKRESQLHRVVQSPQQEQVSHISVGSLPSVPSVAPTAPHT